MRKAKPVHVLQRSGDLGDDDSGLRFPEESQVYGFLEVPVPDELHDDVQHLVIFIPTEATDEVALVLCMRTYC